MALKLARSLCPEAGLVMPLVDSGTTYLAGELSAPV